MKTIEALYNEILENDGLKKEFVAAVQENKLEGFLKKSGCNAGVEEVQAFLSEKQSQEGAITDAELNSVSGGCNTALAGETLLSTVTFGTACLAGAIASVKGEGTDEEYKLCSDLQL